MKQIHKSYLDALKTFSAIALAFVGAFIGISAGFVAVWDWTVAPLFRAPAAPFTAGLGFAVLVVALLATFEVLKERS